jgi:hypothetical protein
MPVTIADTLLTWQTGLFALGIYFLTVLMRRTVEAARPSLRDSKVWRDVLLPSLPVLLGLLVAAALPMYPYPEAINAQATRLFYGLTVGGGSGWLYKVIKALVVKQWGVDISTDDKPPVDKE